MKQLKLDEFFLRGGGENQHTRVGQGPNQVYRERSVLQAFAEYEDVAQNVYVCRPRNRPTLDISYCKCQPRADWTLTCVSGCENQATQTECVEGHCASNYKCGNQRMQRGRHADLSLASLPGKGISLMAAMPIERDTLIAQYVGEVISRAMYLEREEKESRRSPHTYGLAVNTNEVIDARFIGGIARFANHSCSPNCVVERWEVGGETCCGIFSVNAINKGEEITIKYGRAFVRDQSCLNMYNKEENKEEDAPLKNEIFYDYRINMEPWAYPTDFSIWSINVHLLQRTQAK
ncbi:hypothetical protein DVH05_019658 [Phytophthora capsici]|nr:hypothetical protein DVH05_019658 [Phytophthora capsici]